jgi:hypothetical protein
MAMRAFLRDQEETPAGLGKRTLEPYFMTVVRETSRSRGYSARPPARAEPPVLAPFGATAARPVVVEDVPESQTAVKGPPQVTRMALIESQLEEQKERAARSEMQFASMFKALQESLEKVLPHSESRRPPSPRREDPLLDLPSTSFSERVHAWRGTLPTMPTATARRPDPSPATSFCESVISESILPQVPVEAEPTMPRMLAEGQSCFDWDHDGTKWDTREDLPSEIKERVEALDSVARSIASINRFPQEQQPQPSTASKLLGAPKATPSPEVTLPIPEHVRNLVKDSRKHRSRQSFIPPTVRKTYKVPREDWAFLGAVRRPDRIFESFCKTKKAAKGVHQLQDSHSYALASNLQDAIQSSAHTLRPVSAGYQSASTMHDLLLQAKEMDEEGHMREILEQLSLLAQYNLTAMADAADCLARFNSESVRRLRNVWLEQSRLPHDVKESVKTAPVCQGLVPPERGMEFTAPIAGEPLKVAHEQACARAKADKLLAHKSAALGKPTQQAHKRKSHSDSPPAWKKPRQSQGQSQSYSKPPQTQQRSQRAPQRGTRGVRAMAQRGQGQQPKGNQPRSPRKGGGKN